MRVFGMKALLLGATLALAAAEPALANIPELFIVSGGSTIQVIGAGNQVSFSDANFAGWNLKVVFGDSNSPNVTSPYGIDLTTLTATCGTGTCGDLHIWLSDTGFTQPSTSFVSTFTSNQTGTSASSSQLAWVGLGNTFFQSNGADGPPTVSGGTPIPTVGPFLGTGGFAGSNTANIGAGLSPYSLTIENIFAGCSGSNCASYSTDGSIRGVPEPGMLLLLGSGLLGLGAVVRRRK